MAKRKYIIEDNVVKCVSHFAGKEYETRATCNPEDKFNTDAGIKLASARMDLRLAEKKLERAHNKCKAAADGIERAKRVNFLAMNYYTNAEEQLVIAEKNLAEILEMM